MPFVHPASVESEAELAGGDAPLAKSGADASFVCDIECVEVCPLPWEEVGVEAAKALVSAPSVLCGDLSEHWADGFACAGEHACGSKAEVSGDEGCHDVVHFSWGFETHKTEWAFDFIFL